MQKTVFIAGKRYPAETKNGIRYINGLSIGDFLKTLTAEELAQAAIVGIEYIKSRGSKSPQKMFHELNQSKNN